MSDMEKRCDVLDTFLNRPDVFSAMADRIVELEAAVERVRELHVRAAVVPLPVLYGPADWCSRCGSSFPCSTLRALEGTP